MKALVCILISAFGGGLLEWQYVKQISTCRTDSLVAGFLVLGVFAFACLLFTNCSLNM